MQNRSIYMDYSASTPVDQRVLDAMLPFFTQHFGNPASGAHDYGRSAAAGVEIAREKVARLLGGKPSGVYFMSGATEANNLALFGTVRDRLPAPTHVITQATEHSAVLYTCLELSRLGAAITYLGVDSTGRIALDELKNAIRPETVLVSIMTANNELGAIQPIREIGAICREAKILFHTDATQAVGKIPIDVGRDGIDMLSLSAHKIYGPKGVGVLYVRPGEPAIELQPLLFGGGHERGMRSGTVNVPGAVGLGMACELCGKEMSAEAPRLSQLRDRLEQGIQSKLKDVYINGLPAHRMPHITNISFGGADAQSVLSALDGIALSAGSACASSKTAPSHVLRAISTEPPMLWGAIRFSLGRWTTEEEVDFVVRRVAEAVSSLRLS